jgi:hypothetical protein
MVLRCFYVLFSAIAALGLEPATPTALFDVSRIPACGFGIPWIPSSESGLFNKLWEIPVRGAKVAAIRVALGRVR